MVIIMKKLRLTLALLPVILVIHIWAIFLSFATIDTVNIWLLTGYALLSTIVAAYSIALFTLTLNDS